MSRAKRVVNLPPDVVVANLRRVLSAPPYRLVEAGRGSVRFRVWDYDGSRAHQPMEGILRVFGHGTISEIDSDIQPIGRAPAYLTVLAIAFVWTLVVPLGVRWWVRRAPARTLDRILAML